MVPMSSCRCSFRASRLRERCKSPEAVLSWPESVRRVAALIPPLGRAAECAGDHALAAAARPYSPPDQPAEVRDFQWPCPAPGAWEMAFFVYTSQTAARKHRGTLVRALHQAAQEVRGQQRSSDQPEGQSLPARDSHQDQATGTAWDEAFLSPLSVRPPRLAERGSTRYATAVYRPRGGCASC